VVESIDREVADNSDPRGSGSDEPRRISRRRQDVLTGTLLALTVAAASWIPLAFNPQFYFFADTPDGAYGQWYELGQQLSAGNWPLMNPAGWMAGDYVAEGQWGLWNPLILGLSVLITVIPSAVAGATLFKMVFLVIGALGTYALVRSYAGTPRWAALAGFAAPFAGFTLFMDASSWATNLFVWALFPWCVAAIRRWTARGGLNIVPLFVACYLLITVGYVQGTLMLVFAFLAAFAESVIRRSARSALRLVGAGAVAGLIALAVYLPGVLTAPVTTRTGGVGNDGFMVLTLSGLATSSVPSAEADLLGWWGRFTEVPLLYIAWFLPLVLFVSGEVVRRRWRELSGLAIFGALALLLAVGPSTLGPLRFPSRTMPWIALTAIVLTCISLSWTGRRVQLSTARCVVVGATSAFAYWLAVSQVPGAWKQHLIFALLTTAAIVAVWWRWRRVGTTQDRWGGIVIVATILATLLGQSAIYADRLVSRADYPADVADYAHTMPSAKGDGIVIGSPLGLPQDAFREVAFANMWYLNDAVDVQNLYTPTEHREYAEDLCITYDGRTCFDLLERLFEDDATAGVPLADLLSLDAVQILIDADHTIANLKRLPPPRGWSQTFAGDYSVVWTRDDPSSSAGDVVWTTPGVELSDVTVSDAETTFTVDGAPASGGTVVLSRIAWPGYFAANAELSAPLRGYLVAVDLPADASGERVTVTFRPPWWPLVLSSMIAAFALTAFIAGLEFVRLRRARPADGLAGSVARGAGTSR
jgi:hypothetical protein